jgi:hypothetical protein
VVEIPSIPGSRPTISELNLADVVHFLSVQSGGRREMGRDILRLKRISRSRRISRRAVGLIFKAKVGKELRIIFVVDGQLMSSYKTDLPQVEGPLAPVLCGHFRMHM